MNYGSLNVNYNIIQNKGLVRIKENYRFNLVYDFCLSDWT